jgi:hypothetical protein
LIILFHGLGRAVVDNLARIGLVNPQPKGDCSYHNARL